MSSPAACRSACRRRRPPQIGTEGHERQIGLVAEHPDRHHLVAVGLGSLHRAGDLLGIGQGGELAEQVQHTLPDGGADGFGHVGQCRSLVRRTGPADRLTRPLSQLAGQTRTLVRV